MTTTIKHSIPKTLAMGEGETHRMLTHTIVWKLTGEDTNGQYAMFEMTDTSGGSAPVHTHPWEETFYILEGEIEIQIGNQRQILSAGGMSHVPANTIHSFTVISPIARALVMISGGSSEAFYRELSAKITSLPPDMTTLQEIAVKYGLQIR